MALAFEQQLKESDKAFAAFSVYLSLGAERSLAKTAAKLQRSKVMMEKWSRRFDWPARVAAYNSHMALVEREAAEAMVREKGVDWAKRQEELRREAWKKGEELISLADEFIRRWLETLRVPGVESVVRTIELGFKLKGFGAGVPLDVKQVSTTVSGPDGGPIRVEVKAALNKIYGKPLPGEVVDAEVVSDMKPECHELGNGSDGKNETKGNSPGGSLRRATE
jgi:hypothetical protein